MDARGEEVGTRELTFLFRFLFYSYYSNQPPPLYTLLLDCSPCCGHWKIRIRKCRGQRMKFEADDDRTQYNIVLNHCVDVGAVALSFIRHPFISFFVSTNLIIRRGSVVERSRLSISTFCRIPNLFTSLTPFSHSFPSSLINKVIKKKKIRRQGTVRGSSLKESNFL